MSSRLAKPSTVLLLLAIVLASALFAAPAARLGAQDASPATGDPELPPVLVEFGEAWSSGDPDRVVALFAEDALDEEVVLGGIATRSHDELRAYAAAVYAAFPDFAATPTGGFVADDHAVVEWTLTGSYEGQFGDLPPGTGQPVEVRIASVLELDGDKIRRESDYWDLTTLLTQVGAMPGAATPAA